MKKGWEVKKLGEACDVLSGSGFPKKYQGQQDLEYPFYKVSDMNLPLNGKNMIQENNSISSDVRRELGAKSFHAGTVIFPKVGGAILTNKKRVISKPSCVDNNIMGLYPHRSEVCGDYLYWWMDHVDIYDWSNKASPPSITQRTVSNTTIPIPPLSEQEEIVEVLDTAFAAIDQAKANIEQNIANAKELFQSKLNQIFSQKGEGWVETTLGASCKMYQPKTIGKKDMTTDGEFIVFGANGPIGRYHSYNHEASQLLVTCRGATCGSVNISEPMSWITGNAMVIQPLEPELNRDFLELALRGGIDLSSSITGAAQPQITRTNLEPITLRYPSRQNQIAIVESVQALSREVQTISSHYQTKLTSLDELKKSILQKAFAGELT